MSFRVEIEITPDADGVHCGECKHRGGHLPWRCMVWHEEVAYSCKRGKRCLACLAAENEDQRRAENEDKRVDEMFHRACVELDFKREDLNRARQRARKWKRRAKLHQEDLATARGVMFKAISERDQMATTVKAAIRERDEARAWLHQTEEKMDALQTALNAMTQRARGMWEALMHEAHRVWESEPAIEERLQIAAGEPIP